MVCIKGTLLLSRVKVIAATMELLLMLMYFSVFQVNGLTASNVTINNVTLCFGSGDCSYDLCSSNWTELSDLVLSGSNYTLQFCSNEFNLDSVLTIADSHSVKVIGLGLPTALTCKWSNTGIHIYSVTDLVLQDIKLISCGNIYTIPPQRKGDIFEQFISGLYIVNCTGVKMDQLIVSGSQGNGVTMLNNDGTIEIKNSTFERNNFSHTVKSGGSGLHIVLSYSGLNNSDKYVLRYRGVVRHSHYHISESNFSNNIACSDKLIFPMFGNGGGLGVSIHGNSTSNIVEITNCNFTGNSASRGGAMNFMILDRSNGNNITVKNCTVHNNTCSKNGGGINIGYQTYKGNFPQKNLITIQMCRFTKNSADYGGGVSFYSTPFSVSENKLKFNDCEWTKNVANIGSAVYIAPDYRHLQINNLMVQILFSNCKFISNYLKKSQRISFERGRGTFLSVGYSIVFEGEVIFDANEDTGMDLTSTEIEFGSNSNVLFANNQAVSGGAISLLGFSRLTLSDDSVFSFINNSALKEGGAIFQKTFFKLDYFTSETCFITYKGRARHNKSLRNISFTFQNNTAGECGRSCTKLGKYGHSLYATTIYPCYNTGGCNHTSISEAFNCIGNFTFIDLVLYDISTAGSETKLTQNDSIVRVIPGKVTQLPIETLNELSHEVMTDYYVTIHNSNVTVDDAFTIISNKSIKLYGKHDDKADVVLEAVYIRRVMFTLEVMIEPCPPGFVHNNATRKCECSTYYGIASCDDETFQTKILTNYWVGYSQITNGFGSEKDLLIAICPYDQCRSDTKTLNPSLPKNTLVEVLDEIVCGTTRTGVLCSRCKDGYESHYHDYRYICKETSHLCSWGWLFYILSEIIPVTVFFIVIMVFNIQFTGGAVSGFILFAQTADRMLIKANNLILWKESTFTGLLVYRLITGVFKLEFFEFRGLSFCLWRSASTLDLLAFKYITILYASTLVVIIIVIFKYCHNKRINNILVKVKGKSAASIKSTIIHGMSGFLVICYSECTRISLQLLTPVTLYGPDSLIKSRVSFYNGDLKFFHDKHLAYALPAAVILFTLGILPPLLLISYPLCYKVFALLKIGESRFTGLLCTCIPLEKFKPFFDSFQSSFKDEYRFFSGLYFTYRFIAFVTFAVIKDLHIVYTLIQVQLAVILAVHTVCRPYKKSWHNILDAFLFANLSLINLLTLFNYHLSLRGEDYAQNIVYVASSFQVTLLYLPLVYISVYVAKVFIDTHCTSTRFRNILCCKFHTRNSSLDDGLAYFEFSDQR